MPTIPASFAFTLLLTLTLGSTGCRTEQPEPESERAGARTPPANGASASEPTPTASEPAPPSEAPPDPEREAKLADLDDMCLALDRDYSDGTLGDYYGKLQPRTDWAKQQIAAGNESIEPGRLLEQAIKSLAPDNPPAPCAKLLDYLDEVE